MIENESPRTRSLLRQAARNVEGGKLVAADQLYRQILAETPDSTTAWLGLAKVTQDETEKQTAYERALTLEPDNVEAKAGLALLRGEPAEAVGDKTLDDPVPMAKPPAEITGNANNPPEEGTTTKTSAKTETAPYDVPNDVSGAGPAAPHLHGHVEVHDPDVDLFCYRHPDRSTSLRCYKCNKPICSSCAVKTPVGYLCPDCQRLAEDAFFTAKPTDYLLALLVALPVSLLAGWAAVRFSGGFFMILIFIFAGGAVGGFIARLSKRAIGNRRGRYIPYLVVACIIIGVLVWAWPWLIFFFAGNAGVIMKLAGIGVYLFTAASSAFYWAR